MKKLLLILFLSIAYLCTTHAQSFTKLEVKQSMRRVADWQIGHSTELFMVISTG